MNEIFTKTFWEGVKKTFDDALEGKDTSEQSPIESVSSAPESKPESPASNEPIRSQHE